MTTSLRPWAALLLLLVSGCDAETCEPETDTAFCDRLSAACGDLTAPDNCREERTVTCGACGVGETCVENMCRIPMERDAGADDAGAEDAGSDAGVDAGSCLAANGWPMSTLPDDYAGEGYGVGERVVPFANTIDADGDSDVSLGQFYGAMVLLAVHARWSSPSVIADETAQDRLDTLNGATTDYTTVQISLLIDDLDPGADMVSGWADLDDAEAWATRTGGGFPVLAGMNAWRFGQDATITATPTFLVLDPTFTVRDRIEGFSGDEALVTAVQDGWTAFRAENPGWVSTYCAP